MVSRWPFRNLAKLLARAYTSGHPSVSQTIDKVSNTLARNRGGVIRLPGEADWQTIQANFFFRFEQNWNSPCLKVSGQVQHPTV